MSWSNFHSNHPSNESSMTIIWFFNTWDPLPTLPIMHFSTSTRAGDGPVNLMRATAWCNCFYVCLSAAKASLLPFLTLFFRLLGLSPLETGVIMAAKTLTGFVWAPLWARCAVSYNKRRMVLVFSLLMMTLTVLSFTAVYYQVCTFYFHCFWTKRMLTNLKH